MGKGSRGNQSKTRNQRRDDIERKRDERSHRNTLKKEKQANAFGYEDDGFKSFRNQLQLQGFKMRDVVGDGNCLFRAFADQMDGNEHQHVKHRKDVVKYMDEHGDEFIPFLEETVNFKDYLKNLGSRGTYGGNDSIVAFARCNGVDVIIHQLNNPTFIIEGESPSGKKIVIHLAYHDYEHYSSVRRSTDPCTGPAHSFHKETDSIATEKCVDEKRQNDGAVTEEADENTGGSRKERRKTKKKNTLTVEGNKCELSEDFVRESVEDIQTKCGCEDTEYIRNVFIDNSYDVDSTLSFLFQTMYLHDDDKSDAAQAATNSDAAHFKKTTCNTDEEEDGEEEAGEVEINKENDYIKINEALAELPCSACAENVSCASNCCCEESDEEEEKTNNFNEVKKKNTSTANRPVVAKHMSNRQRKELAKQARKKRRQETRKADSSTNTSPPPGQVAESIKSINI